MRHWLKRSGQMLALLALVALVFAFSVQRPGLGRSPHTAQAGAVAVTSPPYPWLAMPSPYPTLPPGAIRTAMPTFTPRAYPPHEVPSPYPTRPPETRVKPTGYTIYITPRPETQTYVPKPTFTPSPVPSATPVPTALPLPPSAYHAVWMENGGYGRLTSNASIWITDPRDIASRRQIVAVSDRWAFDIAVSPNGQWLAYTTGLPMVRGTPLWIVSIQGGVARQVAPNAGQPLWTADSRALVYGTADEVRGGVAIDIVDLGTGEMRRLVTGDPDTYLPLLGWSADKQRVLYLAVDSEPVTKYEGWSVEQRGGPPQLIASPGTRIDWPLLSPSGTKLLFGRSSPEGQRVLDLTTGAIMKVPDEASARLAWGPAGHTLLGFVVRDGSARMQSFDLATGQRGETALPQAVVGQWGPVSVSPDGTWVAAYGPKTSLNGWLHVPSGLSVSVAPWGVDGHIVCEWAPAGGSVDQREGGIP
jgi:Tol biopolymer transport system component